ncbi:unnamed protein product [Protopolystoma xenopodis]|uniref:Uncharacterized protein n=1 Tax=Protopolystoma xenopodis TaxID=117903 RepID=A0A3S5AHW6_9PLAT|nr:unnamed protein product [Protopolystoma xenopodis]
MNSKIILSPVPLFCPRLSLVISTMKRAIALNLSILTLATSPKTIEEDDSPLDVQEPVISEPVRPANKRFGIIEF